MIRKYLLSAILCGLTLFFLNGCGQKPSKEGPGTSSDSMILKLENTLGIERKDASIAISRKSLEEVLGKIPNRKVLKAVDDQGVEIPSQVDDFDLDGEWDEWALVYSLPASGKAELKVSIAEVSELANYPQRTAVHFGRRSAENEPVQLVKSAVLGKDIPPYNANQMDGPAWENELVGYRLYFDGRNARDVFGKKQPEMVLHTVGKSEEGIPVDNYHVMEPWGRDILSVGSSLGAGGIALEENGQLFRLGILLGATEDVVDSTVYNLVSKGAIRSIFTVNYYGWKVNGNRYDVKNTITIWAGQHYYENRLALLGEFENKKNVVVGFVNSNNDNPLVFEENINGSVLMATHDKQTYGKEFFLGLAMLVPHSHFVEKGKAPDEGASINTTFYSKLGVKNGEAFTYHIFSGWELQDNGFTNADYFFDMVRGKAKEIGSPVKVTLETVE